MEKTPSLNVAITYSIFLLNSELVKLYHEQLYIVMWLGQLKFIHEMVVFWGPSFYVLVDSWISETFSWTTQYCDDVNNYNWFMTWLCFEILQCCHSWSTFGGPLLSKKPKTLDQVMQKKSYRNIYLMMKFQELRRN